jgi:hypothetical protein
MTTEATIDYEKMTLDDLRKAAEAEALAASTKTPVQIEAEQQAADDKVAADKAEQDRVDAEEAKKTQKTFYRERTIDLGDGAGVQVFKGKGATSEDALEDLTDKLAEAQRHATKKIREQEAKLKVHTEEPKVTPEDDAMLSEQLLKTPTEAFKKLFKQVTGVDITEFKTTHQKEKAFLAAQEKRTAADEFVASNPEFADTPRNGKLINKWCELHNDFSLDGLNKAYQDLNESGLLDVKGEEASDEQKKVEAETQRIAEAAKASSSQRTRKSSGLSTQRRTAVPTPNGPTEEELYSMPLDKLRGLANKQLAGQ